MEGGCLLERVGVDLRRANIAQLLLDARTALAMDDPIAQVEARKMLRRILQCELEDGGL